MVAVSQSAPQCVRCGHFMPWERYKSKQVFGPAYWNGPCEVEIGICAKCEAKEAKAAKPVGES